MQSRYSSLFLVLTVVIAYIWTGSPANASSETASNAAGYQCIYQFEDTTQSLHVTAPDGESCTFNPHWEGEWVESSNWRVKELHFSADDDQSILLPEDSSRLFVGWSALESVIGAAHLNTEHVTDMHAMFLYAASLKSIDVSQWNTSKVTDMSVMFNFADELESLDVSNWDTSNVTDMRNMFAYASSLQHLDVSNWDTGNVTNMRSLFEDTSLYEIDVSNWDTAMVTNVEGMFSGTACLDYLDVSSWDTSNVTTMGSTFRGSAVTSLDLSHWDTSKVEDMRDMFSYTDLLIDVDVSGWDTSNVTDMSGMFRQATSLTNLHGLDFTTASVTEMQGMFSGASSLTRLDTSDWNTENVTNMSGMFSKASSLADLDVSNWDTSKVTYMERMFYETQSLHVLDLSNWDTSNVTNMSSLVELSGIRTLSLGNSSHLTASAALPVPNTDRYTGSWAIVGAGSAEIPQGGEIDAGDFENSSHRLLAMSREAGGAPGTYTWQRPVYLTFSAGEGGTGSVSDVAGRTGLALRLPTNSYSRPGFEFLGWEDPLTGEEYAEDQQAFFPGSAIGLQALWQEVDPTTLTIESVTPVTGIEVPIGTSQRLATESLPISTTVFDSAGTVHTVELGWEISDYHSDVVGTYQARGTFDLPAGVSQSLASPVPLEVFAVVSVVERGTTPGAPVLTISPRKGFPGSTLTVSGRGWDSSQEINLRVLPSDWFLATTVITNGDGTLVFHLEIPTDAPPLEYEVEVSQGFLSASVYFEVLQNSDSIDEGDVDQSDSENLGTSGNSVPGRSSDKSLKWPVPGLAATGASIAAAPIALALILMGAAARFLAAKRR